MKILRALFTIALGLCFASASEPAHLSLPGSNVLLAIPEGWSVGDKDGETAMYSPGRSSKNFQNSIHLVRDREPDKTLQDAIDSEIDRVTARAPKWGSSTSRSSYRGSTPFQAESGISGLRADFFYDDAQQGRQYMILKYYFFDENGKIFKVCSHVFGDEARFKEFEQAIRSGLKFKEAH